MNFLEKPYVTIPLLLIVAFGIFFNALGNTEEKTEKKAEQTTSETVKNEEQKQEGEVVAFNGEEIYKKTCIGCHGDQYQGAFGPTLLNLKDKYSEEDIQKILKEGKGDMPPKVIDEKDVEKMAAWVLTLK